MKREWLHKPTLIPYLIALFFCLHGLQEYFYSVSILPWLILSCLYFLFIFLSGRMIRLFCKEEWRSALINSVFWMFFFFFSAMHQLLKNISGNHWISSYRFVLPALLIILILSWVGIYSKKRKPTRLIMFINIMLTVWIITDGVLWGTHVISESRNIASRYNRNEQKRYAFINKPSVYLLVFDEYTGSQCMSEAFHFQNGLDSFLKKNEFHVFESSRSNYNFTTFSILSMLQMDYLKGLDAERVTHKDYLNAEKQLLRNRVFEIFKKNDYRIMNYSIFDFDGYQAYEHHYLLPNQTLLLRKRTFFQYVLNDLGWHLIRWDLPLLNLWERSMYRILDYNTQIRHALEDFVKERPGNAPHFVYAHFMMPHPPFFYDSAGKLRPKSEVLYEMKHNIYPVAGYLSNVKHANRVIQDLIEHIQKEDEQAVIIIAGDHGFRTKSPLGCRNFSNYNAVYFPPEIRPSSYPDKITLVNQFRFIFNQLSLYKESFLGDDIFFLRDQPDQ